MKNERARERDGKREKEQEGLEGATGGGGEDALGRQHRGVRNIQGTTSAGRQERINETAPND